MIMLMAFGRSSLVQLWVESVEGADFLAPWASSRLPPEVEARRVEVVLLTPTPNARTGAMARGPVFEEEPEHVRDEITNPDAEPILDLPTADIENIRKPTLGLSTFARAGYHIHRTVMRRQHRALTDRVTQKTLDFVRTIPWHIASPNLRSSRMGEYTRSTRGRNREVPNARGIRV